MACTVSVDHRICNGHPACHVKSKPNSADGGKVEHVERWYLFKVKGGEETSEIEIKVLALINKTRSPAY
jgi:hypothetical protein